jgi:hypothetical protein
MGGTPQHRSLNSPSPTPRVLAMYTYKRRIMEVQNISPWPKSSKRNQNPSRYY